MAMSEEVRCRRCHRLLKNEKAKMQGIGNSCLKKEQQEQEFYQSIRKHGLFDFTNPKGD